MNKEDLKRSWNKGLDKLRHAWEENPLLVIGIYTAAAGTTAQLINAISSARSRRAYARQVDYRVSRRK